MNNQLTVLDFITLLSFVLQLQNNDELQKQSTNDDVLKKLHNDVMLVLEDNRKLSSMIIEQNKLIIELLGGENNTQNKRSQRKNDG